MITDKELEILKKSLIFIKDFPKTMNISSGDEYLKIHNRNIETLKKLAQERKSGYILKKIADYEAVSNVEIDEFVKWKRKDISLVAFAAGRFFGWLINLLKTKGNTSRASACKTSIRWQISLPVLGKNAGDVDRYEVCSVFFRCRC